MTALSAEPTSAPAAIERPAPAQQVGVWWRRLRLWLVLAVVVLTVVAVAALYDSRTERGALDPDAPTPDGARALAVLLRDHGTTVTEVDQVSTALATARGGDTTIMVPFPGLLGTGTLGELSGLPASVRVVLVEPDPFTVEDLDLDVELTAAEPFADVRRPGCELPEAVSAGDAEVDKLRYDAPSGAVRCYRDSLVVVEDGGAEIVLLGAADPLTNAKLDEHGNAALSLGLLSAHDRVLWLLPTGPEAQPGRPVGLLEILPPWVGASALLLMAAGVLAAFWRGRRLGAPIAEPLPVVVRSAETVEGRARLYRRARAAPEAYEALRSGAFARLLPALGLGTEPDYRAVVEAVAARSGRPAGEVLAVLYGPPPTDDAALVAAADLLDTVVENTLDPTRTETARHRFDGEGRPQ